VRALPPRLLGSDLPEKGEEEEMEEEGEAEERVVLSTTGKLKRE